MLLILCAVLLAGSILTGPVWAANDEARALYAKGAFLEASQLAANAGTAEGFALAARALSQHSGRQSATQQEQLQAQCESYARKAIALDAKYANGHFELAAAIGELGRLRGTGWAFLNGVANVVKDNLEKAISLDPKLVIARVALGRWHAEITSRGVGLLFGGEATQVFKQFEEAIRLEPKSIMVRRNYARALITLDKQRYATRAREQLEIALKLEPEDFLDTQELEWAKRDLNALK
jgi:tetratricopeptide (TPR) repeat protein